MKNLTNKIIGEGYLQSKSIIEAFEKINRADFVPEMLREEAEINAPLPIGYGQTISQPATVAFMLELLMPKKGDKIMDVGSGSGWQTALLSQITGKYGKVFGIEKIAQLAEFGENNLKKYNYISRGIAKILCQDGVTGLPEQAPFDKIVVAAAARKIPEALLVQLKKGGRLIIPVEDVEGLQNIVLIEKEVKNKFKKTIFPGFVFVPFVEG